MVFQRVIAAILMFATRPVAAAEPNALGKFKAEPDRQMNALFEQTDGWVGADGNYSVPLAADRTLWLFGDTFVGKIQNGSRAGSTMVNNTAAIQTAHGANVPVRFFIRREKSTKPRALVEPDDGRGWFWPQSGVRIGDRLYLFLSQIEKTDDKSVFGFRQIGQWLAIIANPDADPIDWRIRQHKLPCVEFSPERQVSFGAATLQSENDVYVFGVTEDRKGVGLLRYLTVARVDRAHVEEFPSWQFCNDGKWVGDFRKSSHLADGLASEFSISFLPAAKSFVLVYTEIGMSPNILARTAQSPEGPWSDAVKLYSCPEQEWGKRVFCYAAKAHPELCGGSELLITYAANATDFGQLVSDSRLYWPRFVKVTLAEK